MTVRPADLWYSARLAEPFMRLVGAAAATQDAQDACRGKSRDRTRIRITSAHEQLERAVAQTGDPTLGLKAARTLSLGDAGPLGYAMHSAANVRDALDIAARYIRLFNDALEVSIEEADDRAIVSLQSHVIQPVVAEDFMVAVIYGLHIRRLLGDTSDVECWLAHDTPADTAEYLTTFAPARVRFGAPHSGFSFPKHWLDAPLATTDPQLNEILVDYVEQSLGDLPHAQSVTANVRRLISEKLPRERVTAAHIAECLKMSERTLARRLESEGTTFGAVLDGLRRTRAARYLDDDRLSVEEIAFLLGFSQSAAFYRAFKRWTGKTPHQYRNDRRAGRRAARASSA